MSKLKTDYKITGYEELLEEDYGHERPGEYIKLVRLTLNMVEGKRKCTIRGRNHKLGGQGDIEIGISDLELARSFSLGQLVTLTLKPTETK